MPSMIEDGLDPSVPNPGSPDARILKCSCPAGENNDGAGIPIGDMSVRAFVTDDDCPLHGKAVTA